MNARNTAEVFGKELRCLRKGADYEANKEQEDGTRGDEYQQVLGARQPATSQTPQS